MTTAKAHIDWKAIRADLAEHTQEQPTTKPPAKPNDAPSSAPTSIGNDQQQRDTQTMSAVSGSTSEASHSSSDTQRTSADLGSKTSVHDLPEGYVFPKKTSRNGHPLRDTQTASAVPGSDSRDSHAINDTHGEVTITGLTSEASQITSDTQAHPAGLGSTSPPAHLARDTQMTTSGRGPILADPFLALAAEAVNELEDSREKVAAHLRELVDENLHHLPTDHPEVMAYAKLLQMATSTEEQAVKNLERLMAAHPLGAWQKATVGIGAKQLGRLLGAIRDPYWNERDDRPRSVNELWRYTGYDTGEDGQSRRRKRGEKSNWSGEAKMRTHLVAKQQVKVMTSPYRKLYDEVREHYAEALHTVPCIQCGQKGKPAPAGTPLKLGHQHARGLRAVAKEILKDLWRESERLHREAQAK